MIYFTSDWHIGHENVLRYSKRPFSDIDRMADALVTRFNATVPPGSTTYFLGDMGFSQEKIHKVLTQLNGGPKVLILGNHDKNATAMLRAGFDLALHSATLYIANQQVTLSHCPLPGLYREDTSSMERSIGENWHGEKRQIRFQVPSVGQFHLHGHIHSPNGGKSTTILGRQMDVGVDAHGYKPVSQGQVESWIMKTLKSEGQPPGVPGEPPNN